MRNEHLYKSYDVETDEGMSFTSPIEVLARESKALGALGAGQICPKCGQHGVMFFGDPKGEHWCLACQVASDLAERYEREMRDEEIPTHDVTVEEQAMIDTYDPPDRF